MARTGSQDDADSAHPGATSPHDHDALVAAYARHVNPTFVKLLGVLGYGRVLVRGEGARVWDDRGRAYLDALAGFGAISLGHNHPRVTAAVAAALADRPVHFCHTGPSIHETRLAQALARAVDPPLEVALLSSTGAEAVEAALKLARAATGRGEFVYCRGGYHGTSLGTLSVMGATRMRRPFEPLLRGCSQIPYGDADALNAALTDRVAAFVVEPIQAEAGVILPPAGYLARAQKLCRQRGAVLILDEVQTGLGRTGPLFAYQAEGFVPDVLVLAKALGGGVAAIGATIVSRELHRRAYGAQDRFDLHSSTFAGHAIACAAACAALEVVTEGDLLARSRERGDRLRRALADRLRGHPMVRDVRGRGMLIGVELGAPASRLVRATVEAVSKLAPSLASATAGQFIGQWIAVRLLEAGVLCQPAAHQWDVLKIEPPLVIDDADVDRLVAAVGGILDEYRTLRALLKDVGLRVAAQKRAGWRW